jgi:hypothetical protein
VILTKPHLDLIDKTLEAAIGNTKLSAPEIAEMHGITKALREERHERLRKLPTHCRECTSAEYWSTNQGDCPTCIEGSNFEL